MGRSLRGETPWHVSRFFPQYKELELPPTDVSGNQETVGAHDLFYWPPGHNVRVDADAEIIMFSPQHEHTKVINHMLNRVNGYA